MYGQVLILSEDMRRRGAPWTGQLEVAPTHKPWTAAADAHSYIFAACRCSSAPFSSYPAPPAEPPPPLGTLKILAIQAHQPYKVYCTAHLFLLAVPLQPTPGSQHLPRSSFQFFCCSNLVFPPILPLFPPKKVKADVTKKCSIKWPTINRGETDYIPDQPEGPRDNRLVKCSKGEHGQKVKVRRGFSQLCVTD